MTHALVSENNLPHSRFTDIRDEPMRLLTPIQGYENMPLVSLEKAVEPISHLFDSIDRYVWISKQNCENPEDGLTQDESASIYLYTMEFYPGPSLYLLFNATLRSKEREKLAQWFLFLKLFLTATYKLPSYQGKVWRGMKNVDMSSRCKKGQEIAWWGVSSCTLSLDVLENDQLLGKHGMRTVFSIECKNGKKIAAHSYFQDQEEEVILLPGYYFRVKSALSPSAGFHIIDIEEISPPYPLVAPPSQSVSILKAPVEAPVNQKTSNDNSNSNKIVSEIAPVVLQSKPNIQPETYVKPVLPSNQTAQTEIPIEISQISFYPKSKSEDETSRQKRNKQAIITTVILALLTIFPIATLIFGQIHKNDCPIQSWIPQWMIIFGAVGLATFGMLLFIGLITILCCSDDHRSPGYGIGGCLLCLLMLFFLAWLIAGSVWVFPINKRVQFNETITENYCKESLYKFTFGTLLAQYALIGLIVCFGGCLGLIGACLS